MTAGATGVGALFRAKLGAAEESAAESRAAAAGTTGAMLGILRTVVFAAAGTPGGKLAARDGSWGGALDGTFTASIATRGATAFAGGAFCAIATGFHAGADSTISGGGFGASICTGGLRATGGGSGFGAAGAIGTRFHIGVGSRSTRTGSGFGLGGGSRRFGGSGLRFTGSGFSGGSACATTTGSGLGSGSGGGSGCITCSGGGGSGVTSWSCTICISLGASSGGWIERTSANTASPPISTVAAPLVALGKSGGVLWWRIG